MKEAIIAFALALVVGSYLNGRHLDEGGGGGGGGATPSIPIGDDPPPPTDYGGQPKPIDPDMVSNQSDQANSQRNNQATSTPGLQIPKVDEPGFDRDVIKSASPVLVFFTATGSDACQRELATVEQVAAKTQADVRVVQVDVMSFPALGQQWGAVSVPTFAMFKDGQKVDMASGELDGPSLLALVKKTVPNAGKG
jgi:thioredoxin 1